MKEAVKQLRSFYFALIGPGILMVLLGAIYEQNNQFGFEFPGRWFSFSILGIIVLIAYIIPLWMRIIKIKRVNKLPETGIKALIKFEKLIILSVSLGMYITPVAFIFNFPDLPKYATAFASFYAIYTSFPGDKRLKLDKKIFRITDE